MWWPPEGLVQPGRYGVVRRALGTKWGTYDTELVEESKERRTYFFLTAWSPPEPLVEAMSERFPSLTFALDYFEGGAGFMGSCEYGNGQEVEAASAPYHGDRGG